MSDHPHDSSNVTHIEADSGGQPCFGCYFGAVYDSLRDEQLTPLEADPDELDEDELHALLVMRKLGGTMAYVADGVAAIAVDAVGREALMLIEVFKERLDQMLTLHMTPEDSHAH